MEINLKLDSSEGIKGIMINYRKLKRGNKTLKIVNKTRGRRKLIYNNQIKMAGIVSRKKRNFIFLFLFC